jgi:nicotinate phosphoribosyltransferase
MTQEMTTMAHPCMTTLSAGLDYYKFTMSQLQYEQMPNVQVTFGLINRSAVRLVDMIDIDALRHDLEVLRQRGFGADELAYLAGLRTSQGAPVFAPAYLDWLAQAHLPAVEVWVDGDLRVQTSGAWPLVTFWETVVMSAINQHYFAGYLRHHGLNLADVYAEGMRRLDAKIALLQQYPGIKIVDFGTRRHFGFDWQTQVVAHMQQQCPNQLIGTSNVALAQQFGLRPIGTFAHEMPMVYAAVAEHQGREVRHSHQRFLHDWYARYGVDLSIALTDTFGSGFFFRDFTATQAQQWRGVRHDSGDPLAFGERVIGFYQRHGIDARTKTIVFSDSLTVERIVELYRRFEGRINVVFGWGTNLTNDVGLTPLNIVMKTISADGVATVKLSDHVGKHMGPQEKIERYKSAHFNAVV